MSRHRKIQEPRREATEEASAVELRCVDRGSAQVFELRLGEIFLMSSEDGASERRLAEECLAALPSSERLAVLIGGLGLGLTLRATLEDPRVGAAHVVEIEPEIVRWNHGALVEVNGGALADPRVTVEVGDVRDALEGPPRRYDVVLLDVDNGPNAVTRVDNAPLYDRRSLTAIRRALRRPGVLGVWAERHAPEFAADLDAVFDEAWQVAVDSATTATLQGLGPDLLYCALVR